MANYVYSRMLEFYNQVKHLIQIRKQYINLLCSNGALLWHVNITNVDTYSGVDYCYNRTMKVLQMREK